MHRPEVPVPFLVAAALALMSLPALASSAVAGTTPTDPAKAPAAFTRIDIDAGVTGASFTSAGTVFAGEQDIVTSGYGKLDSAGRPTGGGTVQIYRPGKDLRHWTKVPVITPEDGIIFPNNVTVTNMDGDADNDLLVPSGYFFDTAAGPRFRSAITWWENNGAGQKFERHDVIVEQAGSYHGVQHVDVDGDGEKDLVATSEEAKSAPDLTDDIVSMQFFPGLGGGAFGTPVTVGDQGGSIPVVEDVDGDGDNDIASSQYFGTGSAGDHPEAASFLWWEQTGVQPESGNPGGIQAGDFTMHKIATLGQTGPGFQIRKVPDFRGPGEDAWIGTNHAGRCTYGGAAEAVYEFTPVRTGEAITSWDLDVLSNPKVPVELADDCSAAFKADRNMIFPGDNITSRTAYGQAAPGFFGYGDVDNDGDTDLAVAGDGDHRLFWIEQQGTGDTLLHTLTAPGDRFGQSGGAIVADFDHDGANDLVFSSFDRNTLALWSLNAPPGPTVLDVWVYPVAQPTSKPAATKVTGFKGGKVITRKSKVTFSATVTPAAGRVAKLQRWTCVTKAKTKSKPKHKVCSWKATKSLTTGATGKINFKVKVPRGTSKWRIAVLANATGTAVTTPVRKVVRR